MLFNLPIMKNVEKYNNQSLTYENTKKIHNHKEKVKIEKRY